MDASTPQSIALTLDHGVGIMSSEDQRPVMDLARQIHAHHVAPLLAALERHGELLRSLRSVLGLVPEATPEQILHHAQKMRADHLEQHQRHVDEATKKLLRIAELGKELDRLRQAPATIDIFDPRPLEHALDIVDRGAQRAGPNHWLWDVRHLLQNAIHDQGDTP